MTSTMRRAALAGMATGAEGLVCAGGAEAAAGEAALSPDEVGRSPDGAAQPASIKVAASIRAGKA
ncbi:MAG: hypothetical protein AB7L76_06595 [Burkholderiaceae bacterium]